MFQKIWGFIKNHKIELVLGLIFTVLWNLPLTDNLPWWALIVFVPIFLAADAINFIIGVFYLLLPWNLGKFFISDFGEFPLTIIPTTFGAMPFYIVEYFASVAFFVLIRHIINNIRNYKKKDHQKQKVIKT